MQKIKNKNLIPEQEKEVDLLKNKIEELKIKLELAQEMLKHYQQ